MTRTLARAALHLALWPLGSAGAVAIVLVGLYVRRRG